MASRAWIPACAGMTKLRTSNTTAPSGWRRPASRLRPDRTGRTDIGKHLRESTPRSHTSRNKTKARSKLSKRCFQRMSLFIPQLLQVGSDSGVQLRSLFRLLAQRGGEPLHLLFERLVVLLGRLGTDVAPGREHVAVL